MAEGFANHYGSDVLTASSSGLSPTKSVAIETVSTMGDKNIDIRAQFPKRFDPLSTRIYDLVINMSGYNLPGRVEVPVRQWTVRDPFGETAEVYAASANDIEMKVMHLILELRRESGPPIAALEMKRGLR